MATRVSGRVPIAIPAFARKLWRRLVSMRTALVLLFLLAAASVPGSLLPQRPLNPPKVQAYLATHGAWGRFLDRIGAFDVFGSVWFTAIYLLLFISLIGCLIPRITVYARALKAKPIKAPANLSRLAENAEFSSDASVDEVAAAVRAALRPRWRVFTRTETSDGVDRIAISAEKGYSREAGNLLFHVALLASLVLIAGGRLLSYQGSIVVTEGTGFCNTAVVYDAFTAGRWVNQARLAPFCIDQLNSFTASYRDDGTPSDFKADVTYSRGVNGAAEHHVVAVNHPLRLEGDRVYLINHGFAPTVTVKRPDGRTTTATAPFLPQDAAYTSEGAFQFQGPGTGNDVGIAGLFAPDPQNTDGVITSLSPQVSAPVLAVFAYEGDLGLGEGKPQSVYSLNQNQISSGKLTRVGVANLDVGKSLTLPDGTVITFDGYKQWASMQVSHDPTQALLLVAAIGMVSGLLGSLVVRRRRLWVRITPGGGSEGATVAVGGLARSDSGNFHTEFEVIVTRLQTAAGVPVSSDPDKPVEGSGAHDGLISAGKD